MSYGNLTENRLKNNLCRNRYSTYLILPVFISDLLLRKYFCVYKLLFFFARKFRNYNDRCCYYFAKILTFMLLVHVFF